MTHEPDAPAVVLTIDYALDYLGGAQTAFVRQAEALTAQGWHVVVVAPGADRVFDGTEVEAIPLRVRFTVPGVGLPVLGSRRALRDLLVDTVRRIDAAALIVHSEFAVAGAALEAGALTGVPVLQTVHTFFWRGPAAASIAAPVVRWLHSAASGVPAERGYQGSTRIDNALRNMTLAVAKRADVVLSPSGHQAEALRDAGAYRTVTLSNVSEPMDLGSPAGGEPGISLLWAARFAPEKRLEVALEAMRLVRGRGFGDVRLHVAGGDHRDVEGVDFYGRVPGSRVSELVSAADAVLITSLGFDNQPMIALEAFTRGRPVVVTDPALADEFGAAAVGTSTPDAAGLADAIVQLAEDRALLREAGRAAEDYARARQPAEHAAALRGLIADTGKGPLAR